MQETNKKNKPTLNWFILYTVWDWTKSSEALQSCEQKKSRKGLHNLSPLCRVRELTVFSAITKLLF